MTKGVGVLALQGDFEAHHRALSALDYASLLVKRANELNAVSGIILPGGESSTMLKLMSAEFRSALCEAILQGLPVLATCAGLILLAKNVRGPVQESLDLLDIDVERNAYGRQLESFVDSQIQWTEQGAACLGDNVPPYCEGVFIRAPKITRLGTAVTVLAKQADDPVLVESGSILGATFHPELSDSCQSIYKMFSAKCRAYCSFGS
ncbi:pyridoxal 5'-phosphate synthase glutaminase subunit PdxT [Oligoflexia bacterium]|nr:pyridoxal 5'-phosphate synthase glutaminase subunit PdxT [Oligoflexia bacterium]